MNQINSRNLTNSSNPTNSSNSDWPKLHWGRIGLNEWIELAVRVDLLIEASEIKTKQQKTKYKNTECKEKKQENDTLSSLNQLNQLNGLN